MSKVGKTAAELEAIVRAEAVRVISPWPVGLRMLIFPLGDSWRATFSLEHSGLANYRDDVLPIVLRLRAPGGHGDANRRPRQTGRARRGVTASLPDDARLMGRQ